MTTLWTSARHGVSRVSFAQAAAMSPPVVVLALADPVRYAALLASALAIALAWEAIFGVIRKLPLSFHGVTTALIFVVMIPATLPLWQMVLVLSLGVILGELVFGGRGYGFVNPAVVALCLLVFAFPQVQLSPATFPLALAVIPGAVVLLLRGLISFRVIIGTFAGVFGVLFLNGAEIEIKAIATALSFGLVFLICDPIGAASTNPGRWVYGLVAGGMIVLFAGDGPLSTRSVVFAAMMASVLAPLIDHLVVLAHSKRRGMARG